MSSKSSRGHLKKIKSLKHLYSVYIQTQKVSGKCLPNLEWEWPCQSLPWAHWLLQISQNLWAAEQPFNCEIIRSNSFLKYKPNPQPCFVKSLYSAGPWPVKWSSKQSTEDYPLMIQCLLYAGWLKQSSPMMQVNCHQKITSFLAGWAALNSTHAPTSWLNKQQPRVTDNRMQSCSKE